MLKLSTLTFRRLTPIRAVRSYSSSAPSVSAKVDKAALPDVSNSDLPKNEDGQKTSEKSEVKPSGLVATAFASLKLDAEDSAPLKKTSMSLQQVEEKIVKATDVNSLLAIADSPGLSRRHSLKIVSTLANLTAKKSASLSEFELDPRFLRLCRTLGRQRGPPASAGADSPKQDTSRSSEDLSTVLGVTGDDEAAKLIASLNLAQMVKVMSALSQKKRRSTPLLRALAFNITRVGEALDLKRGADLLYAMASLNFPDPVLMDRVCSDIQEKLPQNKDKSSVTGSIATSLGFLRYKDSEILDTLTDWAAEHSDITRPSDTVSLVVTMATLGYTPANIDKLPQLSQSEVVKPSLWLDYVWSLVVLNKVKKDHISSVLNPDFLSSLKINGEDVSFSARRKLLNVDSYARYLVEGYAGPLLEKQLEKQSSTTYSKEKSQYVASIASTLKSLLTSDDYLRKNCDSKMGFLYDAECVLDAKCNPFPVNTNVKDSGKRLFRVAMLALDYHDMCRQFTDPLGCFSLYQRLLESQGFHVVMIPYTEFSPADKLVNRVQYIERKLRDITSSHSHDHQ